MTIETEMLNMKAQLHTALKNEGIMPGTPAYEAAMNAMSKTQDAAKQAYHEVTANRMNSIQKDIASALTASLAVTPKQDLKRRIDEISGELNVITTNLMKLGQKANKLWEFVNKSE